MRQNFFMDVITGGIFGHYVFYFICERAKKIDELILNGYDKLTNKASTS
jgi:hypothetical protein